MWKKYISIRKENITNSDIKSMSYIFHDYNELIKVCNSKKFNKYTFTLKDVAETSEHLNYLLNKYKDKDYNEVVWLAEFLFVNKIEELDCFSVDELKEQRLKNGVFVLREIWSGLLHDINEVTNLYMYHYAFDELIYVDLAKNHLEKNMHYIGSNGILRYFDQFIDYYDAPHDPKAKFIELSLNDIYLLGFNENADLDKMNDINVDEYIKYIEFMGIIDNDYGFANILIKEELYNKLIKK